MNNVDLDDIIPKTIGPYEVSVYYLATISFRKHYLVVVNTDDVHKNITIRKEISFTPNLDATNGEWFKNCATTIYHEVHCVALQLLLYKLGVKTDEEDRYNRI